jgi:hypothetical protein
MHQTLYAWSFLILHFTAVVERCRLKMKRPHMALCDPEMPHKHQHNRDKLDGVLASAANIWGPKICSHLLLNVSLVSTGPRAHHGCS